MVKLSVTVPLHFSLSVSLCGPVDAYGSRVWNLSAADIHSSPPSTGLPEMSL